MIKGCRNQWVLRRCLKGLFTNGVLIGSVASTPEAFGFTSDYIYNVPMCGPRSVGMGGAFTAVSDDSSALCYNPAGLYFAEHTKETTSNSNYTVTNIETEVAGSSISEQRSGLRGFFGGMTKDPRFIGPFPVAFAVYVPDVYEESLSQSIADRNLEITEGNFELRRGGQERRLAVGASRPVAIHHAIGMVLTFCQEELYIVSSTSGKIHDTQNIFGMGAGTNLNVLSTYHENIESQFVLGAVGWMSRFIDSGVTFGWVASWGNVLAQRDKSTNWLVAHNIDRGSNDTAVDAASQTGNRKDRVKRLPMSFRVGLSKKFESIGLISWDVQYVIPQKLNNDYPINAMPQFNTAIGHEIRISDGFTLNEGIFSLLSAQERLHPGENGSSSGSQHVDGLGASMRIAAQDGESEYFVGLSGTYGKGYASAINAGSIRPAYAVRETSYGASIGISSRY